MPLPLGFGNCPGSAGTTMDSPSFVLGLQAACTPVTCPTLRGSCVRCGLHLPGEAWGRDLCQSIRGQSPSHCWAPLGTGQQHQGGPSCAGQVGSAGSPPTNSSSAQLCREAACSGGSQRTVPPDTPRSRSSVFGLPASRETPSALGVLLTPASNLYVFWLQRTWLPGPTKLGTRGHVNSYPAMF